MSTEPRQGTLRFRGDPARGRWYLDFKDGEPWIPCADANGIPLFTKKDDREKVEAWRAKYVATMARLGAQKRIDTLIERAPARAPELTPIEPPDDGGVYFVLQGDRVKIGVATNIRTRLRSASTFAYYDTALLAWMPGGRAEERNLHGRFSALRVKGEWFRFEGELRALVASLREAA